ncbi:MAG: hypothetical protein JNL98_10995 [Bryobacterales bacterium]|nr:hypothetical protein [Bryobacterales bacterium]
MWDDLKSIFRKEDDPPSFPRRVSARRANDDSWPAGYPTEETSRLSRGVEQFLVGIERRPTSTIVDMGGANQANINYITNLGHRLSSENLIPALDSVWNAPNVSESRKLEDFLEQTLNYQGSSLGGLLLWEGLEYLPTPLLEAFVKRLHELLERDALILAIFHSEDRAQLVANYAYRILDPRTLQISPRGLRRRAQTFSNRALETLFKDFQAIKFFLTRDNFREVLIRR